jgi:hypothetical protein
MHFFDVYLATFLVEFTAIFILRIAPKTTAKTKKKTAKNSGEMKARVMRFLILIETVSHL